MYPEKPKRKRRPADMGKHILVGIVAAALAFGIGVFMRLYGIEPMTAALALIYIFFLLIRVKSGG